MQFKNLLNIGTDFQKFQNAYFDIFADKPSEAFLLMFMIKEFNKFNFFNKLRKDASFYLSYKRIEQDCFKNNISRPTIIKFVDDLIKKKFIKKFVCKNNREANFYLLNFKYINSLVGKPEVVEEKDYNVENSQEPTKIIEIKTIDLPCKNDEKEDIKNSWNEIAKKHELPKVRVVSEKNIKDIKQNIKEVGVSSIKEYFDEIDSAINNSDFLQGKNDRGWKINFNFITQKSSMNKLFNNAYENTNNFLNNITKNESKALRRDAFIDELFKDEQKLIGN